MQKFPEQQLIIFSMQHPTYASISSQNSLLISDTGNCIYKINPSILSSTRCQAQQLKNLKIDKAKQTQQQHYQQQQQKKEESISIHFDNLLEENHFQLETGTPVVKKKIEQGQKRTTSKYEEKEKNENSGTGYLWKMDVGVKADKCQCFRVFVHEQPNEGQPIKGQWVEIVSVLGEGKLGIWYRILETNTPKQDANFVGYQLMDIEQKNKTIQIADYFLSSSNPKSPFLLTLKPTKQQTLQIHKLQLTLFQIQKVKKMKLKQSIKICEKSIDLPKEYGSEQFKGIFVDCGRIALIGKKLVGVYEQFQIYLVGQGHIVQCIQFGNKYVIYSMATSNCLYIYNRDSLQTQSIKLQNKIINLKFLFLDCCIACTTYPPFQIHLFSPNLDLLHTHTISSICSPTPIRTICPISRLCILNQTTLSLHLFPTPSLTHIPIFASPSPSPSPNILHQSTINTLKHRIQIMKTIRRYMDLGDIGSVIRLLNNVGNLGLLVDGLVVLNGHQKGKGNDGIQWDIEIIGLAGKLVNQAKYQSYIEIGLEALLDVVKKLKNLQAIQDTRKWQQCMKILKQIIQSKKIKKLQQQQKNKKIFQLAYQLVHTTNSHLLNFPNKS